MFFKRVSCLCMCWCLFPRLCVHLHHAISCTCSRQRLARASNVRHPLETLTYPRHSTIRHYRLARSFHLCPFAAFFCSLLSCMPGVNTGLAYVINSARLESNLRIALFVERDKSVQNLDLRLAVCSWSHHAVSYVLCSFLSRHLRSSPNPTIATKPSLRTNIDMFRLQLLNTHTHIAQLLR